MKKRVLFLILLSFVFVFSACGTNSNVDLKNYVIEQRNNLFVACDNIYQVTLSTGMREENYSFDGVVNNKVDFGILSISRLDSNPLSQDVFTYEIDINGEALSGKMTKSQVDNSYSADILRQVGDNDEIKVKISFTGYAFNKDLVNVSKDFAVDSTCAIDTATKELKTEIKQKLDETKIEVVTKIIKDNPSLEINNYFWYVGIICANGDNMGVLINSQTGEIVAKKI